MSLTGFTWFFCVLILTGGLIGWLRQGSKASLIASTISGALLALGIHGINDHPGQEPYFAGLLGITALFLLVFSVVRLSKAEGKFMPAGLILLLSAAELCLLWVYWSESGY